MIREFRDSWIQALRSGKYTQTYGRLRDDNGFCAVGVLCDILPDVTWEGQTPWGGWMATDGVMSSSLSIPIRSAERVGLRYSDIHEIQMMNDDRRHLSFPAIADWIERNIPAKEVVQ